MLDKILALFKKSNKCQHENTFDVLFSTTDKDGVNHDFIITICGDCKSIVSYTDINNQLKGLKNDVLDELSRIHSEDVTAIVKTDKDGQFIIYDAKSGEAIQTINFQHGAESINGVTNEDLLSTVLLRMKAFQKTKLRCKETDEAMAYITAALLSIERRNKDREERQVKGTMKP